MRIFLSSFAVKNPSFAGREDRVGKSGLIDADALGRARERLARLTLDEKVLLCDGSGTMTLRVPEVLLSGHHENIRKWRLKQRLAKTLAVRPDLIAAARQAGTLSKEAELMIGELTGFAVAQPKKKRKKRILEETGDKDGHN